MIRCEIEPILIMHYLLNNYIDNSKHYRKVTMSNSERLYENVVQCMRINLSSTSMYCCILKKRKTICYLIYFNNDIILLEKD